MTPTEPPCEPEIEQPEGVGPPDSIIIESEDEADVLNPDGSVKEP